MSPADIAAFINANINTNGAGGITGFLLNEALIDLLDLIISVSSNSRIITSSANTTLLSSDQRVGLNRTVSPAAQQIQLAVPSSSNELIIQDLAGNFNAYPVTIIPSAGAQFAGGRATYVMNENNQTARFYFYGAGLWGVEVS